MAESDGVADSVAIDEAQSMDEAMLPIRRTSIESVESYLLSVPLSRQAKDSSSCGLHCLQMLYGFYGNCREASEIARNLELIPTGVYAQELGYHLLRHGFAVDMVTRDASRFPLLYRRLAPLDRRAAFAKRLAAVPDGAKEGAFWRGLLRFLDAGGRLVLEAPNLDDLAGSLAQGQPPIVCLDAKSLYEFQDLADGPVDELSFGQAGHYVVVVGLDRDCVTIADPSATFGGIDRYPRERFLYAWYSYQAYTLLARPLPPL